MVVYKEANSVTARSADSIDTLNYVATLGEITSKLLEDGLNHIYVPKTGFYKILYVIDSTAYLAASVHYPAGTLVKEASTGAVKKIKITSEISIVDLE